MMILVVVYMVHYLFIYRGGFSIRHQFKMLMLLLWKIEWGVDLNKSQVCVLSVRTQQQHDRGCQP